MREGGMFERDEEGGGEKTNGGEARSACNHLPFLQLHQQGLSVRVDQVYPRCTCCTINWYMHGCH